MTLISLDADGNPLPISLVQHPLTCVSRQLRRETLELFYTSNVFRLTLDMFGHSLNPVPNEMHNRLRFLHGLQTLATSGYVSMIPHLEIVCFPPTLSDRRPQRQQGIRYHIVKTRPRVRQMLDAAWDYNETWPLELNYENGRVIPGQWIWEVQVVGGIDTRWEDLIFVTFEAEYHMADYVEDLNDHPGRCAFVSSELILMIEQMPLNRISEALMRLLGSGVGDEKLVFV